MDIIKKEHLRGALTLIQNNLVHIDALAWHHSTFKTKARTIA